MIGVLNVPISHRKAVAMAILADPMSDPCTTLPALPPGVQTLLHRFLALILTWVSALVYQALLVQCAAHPLVRLARLYDPSAVVTACRDYYHHASAGASSSTTPCASPPTPGKRGVRPRVFLRGGVLDIMSQHTSANQRV